MTVIRFFKIFSITIITAILILIIIGGLASVSTYFTKTQIIKSPISVVWRKLVDVDNYSSWQFSVKKAEVINGSVLGKDKILRFYMTDYDSTIYHEAQITQYEDDKTLTFMRTGDNISPFLRDYQTSYNLKRLMDGTTEISVTVSYKTMGFITKIYNQVYLRHKLGSRSEQNLALLKNSIEKM